MAVTTVEVGTYLSEVFPVDLPSGVYLNKVIAANKSCRFLWVGKSCQLSFYKTSSYMLNP